MRCLGPCDLLVVLSLSALFFFEGAEGLKQVCLIFVHLSFCCLTNSSLDVPRFSLVSSGVSVFQAFAPNLEEMGGVYEGDAAVKVSSRIS